MSTSLQYPALSAPFLEKDGRVNPLWQKFLQGIWQRVGGADSSNAPVALSEAESLANAAQSNAETYAASQAASAQSAAETFATTAADNAQTNAETAASSALSNALVNLLNQNVTIATTPGNLTVTAAQLYKGIFIVDAAQTGNFTLNTDTAANIFAAITNCQTGSGFIFRLVNGSTGATSSATLAAGTGITINSISANPSVPAGAWVDYLFVCTDATAQTFTVYIIGGSTL